MLFQRGKDPVLLMQLYNHVPMARVLSVEASVKSRTSYGGTAPKNVATMPRSYSLILQPTRFRELTHHALLLLG